MAIRLMLLIRHYTCKKIQIQQTNKFTQGILALLYFVALVLVTVVVVVVVVVSSK